LRRKETVGTFGGKPESGHVGFVVNKVALGQVFSEYFCLPLPIFIPPIALHSQSSINWGLYSRPGVTAVPNGLSLIPIIIIIIIKCVRRENIWNTERGVKIKMVLYNVNCSKAAQWRILLLIILITTI
jgi:hypothetical protein